MNLKFGIPCSKIKEKIIDVEIPCTSEEQAMGIAAGCILAGKTPTVYMQNSGLCRCIDICLSLYYPYEIPYPNLIISIRKNPKHHMYIGTITKEMLEMLEWCPDEEIIECKE